MQKGKRYLRYSSRFFGVIEEEEPSLSRVRRKGNTTHEFHRIFSCSCCRAYGQQILLRPFLLACLLRFLPYPGQRKSFGVFFAVTGLRISATCLLRKGMNEENDEEEDRFLHPLANPKRRKR